MTSPDQDTARDAVTMRSNSPYAEISSGVRQHAEPAARQQSYYEAVRGNTTPVDPICIGNSSSTINLVEDFTFPKEVHNYQIRQQRIYPPIPEEDPTQDVDKNSKRISKCVYLLLVSICVVSVSLSIFCSVLTINMQKKIDGLEKKFGHRSATASAQESNPPSAMCLPCDDIKQGPFTEDNKALAILYKRYENGQEICCATSPEQVSTLLELVSCDFYSGAFWLYSVCWLFALLYTSIKSTQMKVISLINM